MGECTLHLSIHKNRLSHAANHTEANLVLHTIPYHCPVDSVPYLGGEFMTMPPARERTFRLYVAKMIIPLELGNSRDPLTAEGKWRRDSE